MTNPTPRDSAQLPPLPSDAALDERIKTLMQQCGHPESMSIFGAFNQFKNEMQHAMLDYAREALRAQAASVEPVAYRVDWPVEAGLGLPRFFGADDRERMDRFVDSPYECTVIPLYAAAPQPQAVAASSPAAEPERTGEKVFVASVMGIDVYDTPDGEPATAVGAGDDAALLDWLEQASSIVPGYTNYDMISSVVGKGFCVAGTNQWHERLRPAIDAALAATKEQRS